MHELNSDLALNYRNGLIVQNENTVIKSNDCKHDNVVHADTHSVLQPIVIAYKAEDMWQQQRIANNS